MKLQPATPEDKHKTTGTVHVKIRLTKEKRENEFNKLFMRSGEHFKTWARSPRGPRQGVFQFYVQCYIVFGLHALTPLFFYLTGDLDSLTDKNVVSSGRNKTIAARSKSELDVAVSGGIKSKKSRSPIFNFPYFSHSAEISSVAEKEESKSKEIVAGDQENTSSTTVDPQYGSKSFDFEVVEKKKGKLKKQRSVSSFSPRTLKLFMEKDPKGKEQKKNNARRSSSSDNKKETEEKKQENTAEFLCVFSGEFEPVSESGEPEPKSDLQQNQNKEKEESKTTFKCKKAKAKESLKSKESEETSAVPASLSADFPCTKKDPKEGKKEKEASRKGASLSADYASVKVKKVKKLAKAKDRRHSKEEKKKQEA